MLMLRKTRYSEQKACNLTKSWLISIAKKLIIVPLHSVVNILVLSMSVFGCNIIPYWMAWIG